MTNYLCSVSGRFPENYLIGVQARRWGVEERYENRIRNVRPGDRLVFIVGGVFRTLHEILSAPSYDPTPLWPEKDGSIFPHRIKISEPHADSNLSVKELADKISFMKGNAWGGPIRDQTVFSMTDSQTMT